MPHLKYNIFFIFNKKLLFFVGRILPLLPPFVFGVYVLFGSFWPNRVVFFNKKQRLKHMSDLFQSWTLALIVLIVAVLINTVILDEIVGVLDNDIFGDLAKVSVKHKLGWQLAISASAFTMFGVFLNWIVALVMMIQTDTGMGSFINHVDS